MRELLSSRNGRIFLALCIVTASVAMGFMAFYATPIFVVDDFVRYEFSRWFLSTYHLVEFNPVFYPDNFRLKGPLWDFPLGILTEFLLKWVSNPHYIRHALTLSLFPLSLFSLVTLLRRARYGAATAFLAAAMLYGTIRFGGHAIYSKDFPTAIAYLLVSLYLWIRLTQLRKKNAIVHIHSIAELTVVSLIPFLLRPPLLLHFAIVQTLIVLFALHAHTSLIRKICTMALPALLCVLIYFFAFPILWEHPIKEWLQPLFLLSDFPFATPQKFFGEFYPPNDLPWWYAFGWIPFIAHPIVLVLLPVGLLLSMIPGRSPQQKLLTIPVFTKNVSLSLPAFLWCITIASWGAILTIQPTLYGGMRHILFLYPPLIILSALGLDGLPSKIKTVLASVIVLASTVSYASWARYSYIYIPRFLPFTNTELFVMDTGKACLGKAVSYVENTIPESMRVCIQMENACIRYANPFKTHLPKSEWDMERFKGLEGKQKQPYFAIVLGRLSQFSNVSEDLEEGRAYIIWEDKLPNGESACMIVSYKE